MACRQCEGIEQQFDQATARSELRRYRRKGPIPSTRLLIELLRREGADGLSQLLDVGGGVGAIHHALLASGVREAVQVDASAAYIAAARQEAEARGHGDRVRFVQGDMVDLGPELGAADLVTLDRVICCYHDMPRLAAVAAGKTLRLLGAVYPRQAWWTRLGVAGANLFKRLQRSPFRVYLHEPAAIDAALRRSGLERRQLARTVMWEVVVYART